MRSLTARMAKADVRMFKDSTAAIPEMMGGETGRCGEAI